MKFVFSAIDVAGYEQILGGYLPATYESDVE